MYRDDSNLKTDWWLGAIFVFIMVCWVWEDTYAQFDTTQLPVLENTAASLIEEGRLSEAAAIYATMLHLYKLDDGLDTVLGIDLAFQLRDWAEETRDWEEAVKWSYFAHFAVSRNPDSTSALYRRLILSNLYSTDDEVCFERDGVRFAKTSRDCKEERFYNADSIIRAVELQQIVIEKRVDDMTQLLFLYNLTERAVEAVYGVDGDEMVVRVDDQGNPSMIENNGIRNRYRWQRYLRLQRDVLEEMTRKAEEL